MQPLQRAKSNIHVAISTFSWITWNRKTFIFMYLNDIFSPQIQVLQIEITRLQQITRIRLDRLVSVKKSNRRSHQTHTFKTYTNVS